MLSLNCFIFVCSTIIELQAISCGYFNCSQTLQEFIIDRQSTPRIVNNQFGRNPAASQYQEHHGNIFKAVKTKYNDAAYLDGTSNPPFSATYISAQSTISTQLQKPQSPLPAPPVSVIQIKNSTKLSNIDIFVPHRKSNYVNVQNLHFHHHFLNLKPVSGPSKAPFFHKTDKQMTSATESISPQSYDNIDIKSYLHNNGTSGTEDIQVWDNVAKTSLNREYSVNRVLKNRTDHFIEGNKTFHLTSTTPLEFAREKEQIDSPNKGKDSFANSSNSAIRHLYNEYTAYGVPLN